jgi:hypothetical protein
MSEILFRYERVDPTSWAYLSSLLLLAIYFKFSRFWSVRNLDLLGLILYAPGLILIKAGLDQPGDAATPALAHFGFAWLFAVNVLFLIRLLLDLSMVRRPLLEPNMTAGGLTFLGVSLFVFLMANVLAGSAGEADIMGSRRAEQLRALVASNAELNTLKTHGPGFTLLYLLPHISTQTLLAETNMEKEFSTTESGSRVPMVHVVTAKVMAILSQLVIVIGIVLVGALHFENARIGLAAATLYLLLPYTAMWTGNVMHALPGALVVWAVVVYRRPLLAGLLLGLAFGTIYYPIFLLPLWISFYYRKGLYRFLIGGLVSVSLLIVTIICTSTNMEMFLARLAQMFGIQFPGGENLQGVWQFWSEAYRYPILAGFVVMSISMAFWPVQKNLGTLITCSAAILLATQFWHAHSGGIALAWFLPLLLLVIMRPNLEDRVAASVVR